MDNRCPNCGGPIENGKCAYCGASVAQPTPTYAPAPEPNYSQAYAQPQPVVVNNYPSQQSTKSKTTALLLAIFLGYFGIHRFYVGKVGTGIIWLLTWGVFGIGWIVDIIMIATGSFNDNHGLSLR